MAKQSEPRRNTSMQLLIGVVMLALVLLVFTRLLPENGGRGPEQPTVTPTQPSAAATVTPQAAVSTPVAGTATPQPAESQLTATATNAQASPAPLCNTEQVSDLPPIAYVNLPPEAHDTMDLIQSDGPFPYDRDGSTFQNREAVLPAKSRGYYREYTVITPGESDRGARRIVSGQDGELYYTDDHYASFGEVICE